MKKVNLSRLHVIIKNAIADAKALLNDLSQARIVQNIKIFERTTDEDLKEFIQSCGRLKEDFNEKVRDLEKRERYIEYLKTVLDEANRKYGISLLLLKAACLDRKLQRLTMMKSVFNSVLEMTHTADVKPADYYKSAFTEDNRIYELQVGLFNNRDYRDASREYDRVIEELRSLQDETAAINQAKYVTIQEYAEFA